MGNRYRYQVHSDDNRGAIVSSTDQTNNTQGQIKIDSAVDFLFRNNDEFLFNPSIKAPDSLLYNKVGITQDTTNGHLKMSGKNSQVFLRTRMPIIPKLEYRISVSVRKLHGNSSSYGSFYCGIHSLDKNYNGISKDFETPYNWVVADGEKPSANKDVLFTDFTWGQNASKDTGDGVLAVRFATDPGAKYFDIVLFANNGASRINRELETLINGIYIQLDNKSEKTMDDFFDEWL